MKLIITTLTLIFISFSSLSQVAIEPIVNWDDYPAYVKIGIEKSIKEKSCQGLIRANKASYDKIKMNPNGNRWYDILSFTRFHLKKIKCY
jgi:hypothetical protein